MLDNPDRGSSPRTRSTTPHDLQTHTHDLSRRNPSRAQSRSITRHTHTRTTRPPRHTHLPATLIRNHPAAVTQLDPCCGDPITYTGTGTGTGPGPMQYSLEVCSGIARAPFGTSTCLPDHLSYSLSFVRYVAVHEWLTLLGELTFMSLLPLPASLLLPCCGTRDHEVESHPSGWSALAPS